MTTYTGTIERILFQNTDSAWAAVIVNTDKGLRKASGIMPGLRLGMTAKLSGEIQNTKYGESLNASEFCEEQPSDIEGIEKYLASGLIKNIGPKLAHQIVSTFGVATLHVLDNEPERLNEVYGIGKKRVRSIIDAVKEQTQIRSIMIWLKRYDLSNGLAAKIYRQYEGDAIRLLEENPYRLSDDIKGVGFHKADDVARRLGMDHTSRFRICSGVHACLEDWAAEGSTYMEEDTLVAKASSEEYLSVEPELVRDALILPECDVALNEGRVYLPHYFYAEEAIAKELRRLVRIPVGSPKSPDIAALQKGTGVSYSEQQKDAINKCVLSKVSVITGGPGTGKTVTTNAIIRELEGRGRKVVLAAPTGRAAKRMNEVTGRDASTIHRLLEFTRTDFGRNKDNPIEGDVLIVDEASMIDTLLMRHLVEAIPDRMQLVIVGDVDQLPSVGAGCVLRDVIDSGCFTTVRLTQIYRQAQDSDIIMGAHAVNKGITPKTDNRPDTDFWFFPKEEKEDVADLIVDLVSNRIPNKFGFRGDDIQVLSPMKRETDPIGSTQLNRRLQAVVNPGGELVAKRGETEFRKGDRIMQVKNDYDKGIFNGDIGRIVAKCDESDEEKTLLLADFDGLMVGLSRGDLTNIELAYACTVHKSQGSEYPVIVMPVHESQYIMLKRNLIYTGITRAKKQCILVGSRRALAIGVANEDTRKRFTSLKEKLQYLI